MHTHVYVHAPVTLKRISIHMSMHVYTEVYSTHTRMENGRLKGDEPSAAEVAALAAALLEAKLLLSATEKQFEDLKNEFASQKATELCSDKQLDDLRKQLEEAQRASEAAASRVPQLEKEIADLRQQLVTAQHALADAERRLSGRWPLKKQVPFWGHADGKCRELGSSERS